MDLLKLNDYTPKPPTTYDVEYSDVNGEKSQVEDGTTYCEKIRADVPKIKVGWTNLTQEDVVSIPNETKKDLLVVQYFYGTMLASVMIPTSRNLKLKHIDEKGNTYWDLSFELEG